MIETERLRVGPLPDEEREASIRVLEKCGFVRAGGTDEEPVYAASR